MAFPQDRLNQRLEIAVGSLNFGPGFWQWVDVTDRLPNRVLAQTIPVRRGRADESSTPQPSSISFSLDNSDGAFTPDDARSPYWPNVRLGTPVRIVTDGGARALHLRGLFGRVSTPSSNDFAFSGDFDVRVRLQPDQWSGENLASARQAIAGIWGLGGQWSWKLELEGPGYLVFSYSPDGSGGAQIFSTETVAAIRPEWVAVKFTSDNGNGGATVAIYRNNAAAPPEDLAEWVLIDEIETQTPGPVFGGTEPLMIGALDDFQEDSFRGQVFGFELRDETGTIVADPNFAAQLEGVGGFLDSTGKVWTLSPTAAISTDRTRFVGAIDEIRPTWPSGDNNPTGDGHPSEARTFFTVSGLLRRLQQGAKPLRSTLTRHITSPANASAVAAYWPCEENAGANRFASPNGQAPIVIAEGISTGADSSLPASAALPTVDADKTASWSVGVTGAPADHWVVEFFARVPTPAAAPALTQLLEIRTVGTAAAWRISLNDVTLSLEVVDSAGIGLDSASTAYAPFDFDEWQKYRLEVQQVNANIQWNLTRVALDSGAGSGPSGTFFGTLGRVAGLGNELVGPADGLSFGHIVVADGTIQIGWTAGADTAWVGETAAHRFARLCREQSIDVEVIGDPTTDGPLRGTPGLSPAMGPQRQNTFVDLLNECVDLDQGVMLSRRAVPGFVYRTRQSLYNQAPQIEFDAALNQIINPFEPVLDDQRINNDATVNAVAGSSARAFDQAHIDANDLYDTEDEIVGVGGVRIQTAILGNQAGLAAEVNNQNEQFAAWRLHLGTWPGMRYPALSTDLSIAPALLPAWHDLEPGDRVTVVNLPIQHPQSTVDLFVEAIDERISPTSWRGLLTTSAGGPHQVGELAASADFPDVALQRLTAADETRLAASIDETATTLELTTTVWTTAAGQYPMLVTVGGETIRAAAVEDDGGLQRFTGCTRSVNGVVKSHTAGAVVEVAEPFRLALGPGDYTTTAVTATASEYSTLYATDFTAGASILDDFNLYTGPVGTLNGNNGWGGRRASQVAISTTHPTEGSVMNITAKMGAGADTGILISGGAKLWGNNQDYSFRYGRIRARMRMDLDADEVTSGLALLWQADTPTVKGPEVNIYENFANRDTRNPIQMFLHWGTNGEFQKQDDYGAGPAGNDWHDFECVWQPDLLTMAIDGGTPVVLSTDPAEIPQEHMDLAFQNDAWSDPAIANPDPNTPAHQPVLTAQRVLQISSFSVETWNG